MSSLCDAIVAARDGIDRYGVHAASCMDDRSETCRAAGDPEGRAFWAHVAWVVRTVGAARCMIARLDRV
jgi:hypothetical protein